MDHFSIRLISESLLFISGIVRPTELDAAVHNILHIPFITKFLTL